MIPPVEPLNRKLGLPQPRYTVIVKMTETKKGSPNGYTVKLYKVGKEYDLPPRLAEDFINSKSAVEVSRVQIGPTETKPAEPEESKGLPAEPTPEDHDAIQGRGDVWPLTMSPGMYIQRFPEGPKRGLADYCLGTTDVMPE